MTEERSGGDVLVRRIKSYEECRDFVLGFCDDHSFSDPMLTNEDQLRNNLVKPIEKPEEYCVLGIYREERMIGLFSFLVLREERYVEMLVGLSRDREAYLETFRYLEERCPGYRADFVCNPGNYLLRELLGSKAAQFEPEQQKMVLSVPVPEVDTAGVEPYSEQYAEQYFAIHDKDVYWTGEKVAAAQDRFRTFLAVQGGRVVGYLDVTCCFDVNEPYDLFVLESCRRMGYGRKLLAEALERNKPNGMLLFLDVDNVPAVRLCESLGFRKAANGNSVTAHCILPYPGGP